MTKAVVSGSRSNRRPPDAADGLGEQALGLLLEADDLRARAGSEDLLDEDAMKRRIDPLGSQHRPDEGADDRLQGRLLDPLEMAVDEPEQRLSITAQELDSDGVLAGEVLVEGADANPGGLRDTVRRRSGVPAADENASSRFEDGLDHFARTRLFWRFSRAGAGSRGGGHGR